LLLIRYVAMILSRSSSRVFVFRAGSFLLADSECCAKRAVKRLQHCSDSTSICRLSKVGSSRSLSRAKASRILLLTSPSNTSTSRAKRLSLYSCGEFQMLNMTDQVASISVLSRLSSTAPFEPRQALLMAAYCFRKYEQRAVGASISCSCQKSSSSSKEVKERSVSPVNLRLN
jgi:hypothetical protein